MRAVETRLAPSPVPIARALGSTTRAQIYEHLKASEHDLTVKDVAESFDLHPNVARTHLSVLADAGLLVVGRRKHAGGGRPARIYRAKDDVEAELGQLDAAGLPAGGAAAALVVRLLVGLLDRPSVDGPLAPQASRAAIEEGRRLVASLPAASSPPTTVEAAAAIAVRALRAYAPEARVRRGGADWAEISGTRAVVALVERVDPTLAEVVERGLILGAVAATGATVTLGDAEPDPGGERAWRLAASSGTTTRATIVPAATVDSRSLQRETGVVEAMRAITRLRAGDVVEVLAEGPGAPAAFARWADRAGHQLLAVERVADAGGRHAIRLLIRKGPA